MKWTPVQTEALKELCLAGISNATMAEHFCVPVTEIHRKRSELGVTIPKVLAMQGKPPLIVNPEFEAAVQEMDRQALVAIHVSREEILDELAEACDTAGIPLETAVRWIRVILDSLTGIRAEVNGASQNTTHSIK